MEQGVTEQAKHQVSGHDAFVSGTTPTYHAALIPFCPIMPL